MTRSRRSLLMPWLVAVIGFPIGGFIGHLVAGPAATVAAALASGLIAGAGIGLAQAVALSLRSSSRIAWIAATAAGLGVALAAMTAATGQIETTAEAVILGGLSGLAIGTAQAALLVRDRVANALLWAPATGLAWSIGWLVTASIGVALVSGWPVFGLSGALAAQVITGLAVLRLLRPPAAVTA